LALYQGGYLDSEIYAKGRRVTIAGTVQGEKVQMLGEIEYHYPYLIVKEIHLWVERKGVQYEPYYQWGLWYDPYPWGMWYDPWGPWWYPWGYRGHYHHWHH
jgi:outer membrane lipoprotein